MDYKEYESNGWKLRHSPPVITPHTHTIYHSVFFAGDWRYLGGYDIHYLTLPTKFEYDATMLGDGVAFNVGSRGCVSYDMWHMICGT